MSRGWNQYQRGKEDAPTYTRDRVFHNVLPLEICFPLTVADFATKHAKGDGLSKG
jgi:hypothetical protein